VTYSSAWIRAAQLDGVTRDFYVASYGIWRLDRSDLISEGLVLYAQALGGHWRGRTPASGDRRMRSPPLHRQADGLHDRAVADFDRATRISTRSPERGAPAPCQPTRLRDEHEQSVINPGFDAASNPSLADRSHA